MVMLVVLLLLVPVVELYVIVQVSHSLGVVATLGLLVLVSLVGAWLVRAQGLTVWRRLNAALAAGRMPTDALIDGFLVLLAGALLLVPGFVTDAIGLLLLLPPVRAGVRVMARRRYGRRVRVIRAMHTGASYDGRVYDVGGDVGGDDGPSAPPRELGR